MYKTRFHLAEKKLHVHYTKQSITFMLPFSEGSGILNK